MASSEELTLLYEEDDAASLHSPSHSGGRAAWEIEHLKEKTPIAYLQRRHNIIIGFMASFIILISLCGMALYGKRTQVDRGPRATWSPAQGVLEYELSQTDEADGHSTYAGPPTPAQDAAWSDLVQPSFFRASIDDMKRAGESTDDAVEVADGGYIATLAVYHELHCLRHLKFHLYQDHYYSNLTTAQEIYLQKHLDHCLESLRAAVMCHGDVALYSFKWHDANNPAASVKSNSQLVCAKWDSIESWSRSRMLPYNYPLKWLGSPNGLA